MKINAESKVSWFGLVQGRLSPLGEGWDLPTAYPPRVLVCVSYMVSACHVIRLEVWVQSLGHVTTYISHVTTSPLSKLAFLK